MSAKIENIGISVSNPIYFQDFRIRIILVLLSVVDVGQLVCGQRRTESIPLVHVESGFQYGKLIVGVDGDKLQRIGNVLALIQAVRYKTGIEIHKILAFTVLYMAQINGLEHPHALLALKVILLYHTRFQVNPLYLHGLQRSVAHHVHVALTVEKQRIIILLGKQVVVLPEAFLYLRRSVPG